MIRILIELRPLLKNHVSEETKQFIINGLCRVAAANPENTWYFLADKQDSGVMSLPVPRDRWIIKRSYPGSWGWRYWYDWQIPRIIKKQGMDLLITAGGTISSTGIPQGVWMPGLQGMYNELKKAGEFPAFYKKRLKYTLEKAGAVFVFSENNKKETEGPDSLSRGETILVPGIAEEDYFPLSWTEKENIKIRFAGGREYFLITGEPGFHQCIELLKAFSQFKKMQQSNMQMLFAVKALGRDLLFSERLANYKYRRDIILYDSLSPAEAKDMLSGAYAIFCPVYENEVPISQLNACKAGVPVITSDTVCTRQTLGEAVLYMDRIKADSISALLINLYKDETLRRNLIENGKIRAALYTREQSDAQIWKGISAVLNKL
jgi:glycosyltransferase involved in cell wall biosynthesis